MSIKSIIRLMALTKLMFIQKKVLAISSSFFIITVTKNTQKWYTYNIINKQSTKMLTT